VPELLSKLKTNLYKEVMFNKQNITITSGRSATTLFAKQKALYLVVPELLSKLKTNLYKEIMFNK